MRLLSRFLIAALVGFSVSSLIALASYSLGLWLGRDSILLRTIVYYSCPFALLLGVAAAAQPRRSTVHKSSLLVAVLAGTVLGFAYTYFVARFSLPISVFAFLMLSCWVPSGISAMLVAAFDKRLPVVTGIAVLCLSAIFLKEPIFNAYAHNQQLTVAFITPSEASTTQLEVNPETLGFANSEEIQTARNEVLERVRALGYTEAFRVLSITRWGKGRKSLAILVVRAPITKEVVLPVPDKSTVVYIQQSANWEKKPREVSVLHRGITMEPPGTADKSMGYESLGYFRILDAQGFGVMGRIIARAPVQPH